MDEPLSPILMVDSPHSTSFAQRNATAAAGSASRAMPDSPSVLHSRSSFFVIQDDQCPLGTKIGKLWKRHRANRIYETFFFKVCSSSLPSPARSFSFLFCTVFSVLQLNCAV